MIFICPLRKYIAPGWKFFSKKWKLFLYCKDFSLHFSMVFSSPGSTSRACIVTAVVPMDVVGEAKALGEALQKLQVTIASCHQPADLHLNWNVYSWVGGHFCGPCGSSLFFYIFFVLYCVLKYCFLILPLFSCRRVMGSDVILADWVEPNTPTFLLRLTMNWAFDPATSYILEEPERFDAQCQWKEWQNTCLWECHEKRKIALCFVLQLSATTAFYKSNLYQFVLQLTRFGKELEKIDIPKYRGNYIQYNAGNFSFWDSNWLESADISSSFTFVLLVIVLLCTSYRLV